jgi:mono/diheme cytochrome c family protein
MKTPSRLLALVPVVLLAVLLAGCGAGLAEDASGEEIYNARCASCHRQDFSGGIGPPLGPGSEAADRPREYYEVTITAGIGRMPSFRTTLSEAQIDRVIDYVLAAQSAG